jgi:hypothetical protein
MAKTEEIQPSALTTTLLKKTFTVLKTINLTLSLTLKITAQTTHAT